MQLPARAMEMLSREKVETGMIEKQGRYFGVIAIAIYIIYRVITDVT